ncbi:MAG: ATP-dependent Clp protease adaptor ClpS [Chitinophagales bacterium]|nr:ATP-dependent Clp protease adaptor ClpS [Chitinophagales bacterium]
MAYRTEIEQEVLELTTTPHKLVLHNDDVNTFDWVIETLIKVCKHTQEQAEQCAYIIHYKGKYAVKQGTYETLKQMKDAITERGINATIDK